LVSGLYSSKMQEENNNETIKRFWEEYWCLEHFMIFFLDIC